MLFRSLHPYCTCLHWCIIPVMCQQAPNGGYSGEEHGWVGGSLCLEHYSPWLLHHSQLSLGSLPCPSITHQHHSHLPQHQSCLAPSFNNPCPLHHSPLPQHHSLTCPRHTAKSLYLSLLQTSNSQRIMYDVCSPSHLKHTGLFNMLTK